MSPFTFFKNIIPLQYSSSFIFFIFGWISFYFSGVFSYSLILFAFVFLPLVEVFLPKNTKFFFLDLDSEKDNFIYDLILYLTIPLQYISLFLFLFVINNYDLSNYDLIGKVLAMGTLCGHSINIAHELGHRSNKFEQFLAKLLLLSSLYMHFFIEHNKGHHRRVGTFDDPATARKGEWLYAFFFRSIVFQYLSAWQIELKRLKIKKISFFSFKNEMIQFTFLQLFIIISIFYLNVFSGFLFVISAIFGIILLETINYVEHYGLVRKLKDNGRFEALSEFHSWNSDFILGRLLLHQLTLHSDHHLKASKKYQYLKNLPNAPRHPSGYPGMMVLAFFPPLWFFCMNHLVEKYRAKSKIKKTQTL